MGYTDGEALILTKVRTVSGFTSANTSRGDWKILGSGKSDHYAILHPGEFAMSWPGLCLRRAAWTTIIEVWQRYVDDATTRTDLYANVAALIAGLDAWPHMGQESVIDDANVAGGAEPALMRAAGGDGPTWLRWDLRVEWSETTETSFSE